MTDEKFNKIKQLVTQLHDELKSINGGPVDEYVDTETYERESYWYMVYLSLTHLINMEL